MLHARAAQTEVQDSDVVRGRNDVGERLLECQPRVPAFPN